MGVGAGNHRAVVEITARTTNAEKNVKELQTKVEQLTRSLDKMSARGTVAGKSTEKAFGGKVAAGASAVTTAVLGYAAAAAGAFYAIDRLAEREQQWSDVNRRLAVDVRAAADAVNWGTDKLNLATAASKLNAQGLAKSSEEMARFAGGVDALADATGVDLTRALELATNAATKGTTKGLEQLGVQIDLEKAVEEYAASVGKSTGEVTKAEKQQIVMTALMEQGEAAAFAYGGTLDGTAHSWTNFKNKAIDQLDQLNDAIWSLPTTMEDALDEGVRDFFNVIGDDAGNAELRIWQVKEALTQAGKEAAWALSIIAPIVSAQFGGSLVASDMERGDLSALGESMTEGGGAARKKQIEDDQRSRAILENQRKMQRAFTDSMRGSADEDAAGGGSRRGGGRARKEEAVNLYAEEEALIKQIERTIETQKALGESTEAMQRLRFEKMMWVAKASGDVAKQEELAHTRSIERIELQQEWEAKRAESTKARLEAELSTAQQKADLEALALEGQLIGEEDEVAAHQIHMEIAEVEYEKLEAELDIRRQILEARFPEDEADRIEIQAEMQALDHEQRMEMLGHEQDQRRAAHELNVKIEERERKMREKRIANVNATAAMADAALMHSAEIATYAAESGSKSGAKAATAFMKIRGVMAIAQGIFDTAQAVSSFASFNYVQGAMYIVSAATNYATGAKLLAGNPGHGASVSSAASFGSGSGGFGGSAPSSNSSESSNSEPSAVPKSVPPGETGHAGGKAGAAGKAGGQTIIVQGDVVGDVTDSWAAKVDKKIKKNKHTQKVTA